MRLYIAVFCCLSGVALAHSGVKDPDVKARMDLMSGTNAPVKVLVDMARGVTAFDADAAQIAVDALAQQAREMPAAFESGANDPKSEALPAIWTNWDDFVAKSEEMTKASEGSVATLGDLRTTLTAIGKTCSACHEDYREERHDH